MTLTINIDTSTEAVERLCAQLRGEGDAKFRSTLHHRATLARLMFLGSDTLRTLAAERDRLSARVTELEAVLSDIVQVWDGPKYKHYMADHVDRARAALQGDKPNE